MKLLLLYCALFLSMAVTWADDRLEKVAGFPNQQVTGVTVSKEGRVFVNFPFWADDHTTSVAEVIDGKAVPYPDEAWQGKSGDPQKRWVCVQSVVVDDQDYLWVLDPASPKTEGTVAGGPKLVKIDLKTNEPVETIALDASIAPEKSYLNDVRFDTKTEHAFITESGTGAIIVVDLKTGKARRLLADHPSTKVEGDKEITVDKLKVMDPKTGKAPAFHADGVALDQEGGWLYYHAVPASALYRIKTAALVDESLTAEELAGKVEKVADTAKPDGMLAGWGGEVYLTAIEDNAILRFDPKTKKTTTVVADPLLQWPDSLAWGPGDYLYITTSQIHRMPKYHGGESKQQGDFAVWRIKVAPDTDPVR